MDLEPPDASQSSRDSDASCSICLEQLTDHGARSIANLQCGHRFHLDCIGSAFNAKGAMQCPNCRKVEKGRWLYANGHRSSSDFDLDAWVSEDFYDLSYSELDQVLLYHSQHDVPEISHLDFSGALLGELHS